MVETQETETALFPERVGDVLRAARNKAGLDLADVATKTRVPLRHLEAIDAGDYRGLPSPTYCIGFVKAYARAVGADEHAAAQMVRTELNTVLVEKQTFIEYEIADSKHLPGNMLVWTGVALAVLVAVFSVAWLGMTIADPRDSAPVLVDTTPSKLVAAPRAAALTPPARPTGQVTLTATQPVWLKIYEAGGKRIFEKEMAIGETYTVPADATKPQILTGRPEALSVSVGGQDVAPLGPPERTVKDIDLTAEALTARPQVVAPLPTQP